MSKCYLNIITPVLKGCCDSLHLTLTIMKKKWVTLGKKDNSNCDIQCVSNANKSDNCDTIFFAA